MKGEDGYLQEVAGEPLPPAVKRGVPRGVKNVAMLAAGLLFPACFFAGFTWGADAIYGVLGGGAVALGNFWLLSRLVVTVTSGAAVHPVVLLVQLMFKLVLLGFCVLGLLAWLQLHLVGVVLGLSVVVCAAVLGQLAGLAS